MGFNSGFKGLKLPLIASDTCMSRVSCGPQLNCLS